MQETTKKQDVLGAVEQQQRVGVIHASYMGTVVRLVVVTYDRRLL